MAALWLKAHAHQIGLFIFVGNYGYHHHNYIKSFFKGKPSPTTQTIDQDYQFPSDFEETINKVCKDIETRATSKPKKVFEGSGIEAQGDFTYRGESQRPTGEGVVSSVPTGVKMIGKFTDGKLDGEGTIIMQNEGQSFKGILKDGVLNGLGILEIDRGFKYEGNFKESRPKGVGKYMFKDGRTCIIKQAEYDNAVDFANCFDLYKRKIYKGEWDNSNFNGKGTFYFADGRRYEGDFEEGEMHGYGKLFDPYGDLEYRGTYEHDYRVDTINKFSEPIVSGAVILGYILTRFIR